MSKCSCGYCCTKIKGISVKIGKKYIIEDVNIHIHCGELTVIIGPNGGGKTTLLKALIGEIKHEGNITFADMHDNTVKTLDIGYVPQKLNIDSNNPTSVFDLFASSMSKKSVFIFKNKNIYNDVFNYLKKFGAENLIDKRLCDLSGGELQRVMIGFATIANPKLLILDEPVSGIDSNGMEIFYSLIEELKENMDIAIILVSHDFKFVSNYADKVILLNKKVLAEGSANQVFSSKEFTDHFGGFNNGIDI